MNSQLQYLVAREHIADLIEAADRDRLIRQGRRSRAINQRSRTSLMAWIRRRFTGRPVAAAEGTRAS
jgi:hypothetical protein